MSNHHRARFVCTLAALAAPCLVLVSSGCDGGASGEDAGGSGRDAASSADAGPTATDSGTPSPDGGGASSDGGASSMDGGRPVTDAGTPSMDGGGPPTGCGTSMPDISGVTGTEGAIVGRDGTLYFSQSGGVGRVLPDGKRESSWARVGAAGATVWGLALDATNENLFVGVPRDGIYRIGLAGPPAPTRIVTGGAPNGLTIGADGFLYYSDFGAGQVLRVSTTGGTPSMVTTSMIPGANGVAFEASGALLVASYSRGELLRLTLTDGVETARARVARGLGAPDGLALDAMGRIYVTDNGGGNVLRLQADGTGMSTLLTGVTSAAALEFGAGPLRCTDLYVASGRVMRRIENDAPGAPVLWH